MSIPRTDKNSIAEVQFLFTTKQLNNCFKKTNKLPQEFHHSKDRASNTKTEDIGGD